MKIAYFVSDDEQNDRLSPDSTAVDSEHSRGKSFRFILFSSNTFGYIFGLYFFKLLNAVFSALFIFCSQ